MDWMVYSHRIAQFFGTDISVSRLLPFLCCALRRQCPPFALARIRCSFDAPALALRYGSIIRSTSSQSQWMWHYVERYRTSVRNQNLFLYIWVSRFVHTFEIMAIRHRLLCTPSIQCQQYIEMLIFRIHTKPNDKKPREATHYRSIE